jgi:alpha-1,2-mannosyltransferase
MDAQPDKRGTSRILVAAAALLGLYQLACLVAYFWTYKPGGDNPLFSDFYAFWSFGRFLDTMSAARIYDFKLLESFQHALLPGFHSFYPCVYPPTLLLFLKPLAMLGYLPAFLIWTVLGLGGFILAVGATTERSLLPWLAVLAPTTVLTIIFGQNGLITAALLIGAFRIMERRPWLAGVLLGLLSCKPQLFVLLPLVLLAGRRWRTLFATGGTVLALVATSLVAFGVPAWLAWLKALPGFSRTIEVEWNNLGWMMPTVSAALRSAGASPTVLSVAQLLVAGAVTVTLLALFHHGRRSPAPSALDSAALQVGVFLTTPYAFIYDMPMVSAAAVTLAAARLAPGRDWRPGERVLALTGFCLPMFIFSGVFKGIPLGPVILIPLFALLVRAAWTESTTPRTAP